MCGGQEGGGEGEGRAGQEEGEAGRGDEDQREEVYINPHLRSRVFLCSDNLFASSDTN